MTFQSAVTKLSLRKAIIVRCWCDMVRKKLQTKPPFGKVEVHNETKCKPTFSGCIVTENIMNELKPISFTNGMDSEVMYCELAG